MGSIAAGAGAAAQGAAQIAATKLQIKEIEKARQQELAAGNQAAQTIQQAGDQAGSLYQPYTDFGTQALQNMTQNLPQYNQTDSTYTQDAANQLNRLQNGMTEAYLKQTPGYQFTLSQGLESANNGMAARGLANSGAAQKAAEQYATGLADQTYMNQANTTLNTAQGYNALNQQAQQNLQNTFARQNALLDTGMQATGAQAANITNTAGNAANAKLAGAGAGAALTAQSGNALQQGISNIGGAFGQGLSEALTPAKPQKKG
ncbi:hypothetical protein [Oecophyllibacter saccharovorans]|uniref:hypothetical protein n=1 Tax=Oecophyllibacter saccharovorans TaxID=2558360 RepID=UPI001174EA48|nr:hypothetical protein [Oecophyllibacter saccharovorans]TPW36591.1 hypothetical protein E3203_02175 [Oecophyllibacter saccharovorans]